MYAPAPAANEWSAMAPLDAVIAHGPSNANVAAYPPLELAVAVPEPFLQVSVILALASAAPTAAVALTVDVGELPLPVPPPHATSALVASTMDSNSSVLQRGAV